MPQNPPPTTTASANATRTPLAIVAAAGLALLAASASSVHAQSTIAWASPVDGDFDIAANWLPMVVPGASDTALLGGVGAYLVTLHAPAPVGTLVLQNPDASLLVRPGAALTVGGLSGAGSLRISDATSTSAAELLVEDGGSIDAAIRLGGTRTDRARIIGLGSSHTLGRGAVVTAGGGSSGSITGPWTSEATIIKAGPGTLNASGLNVTGGTLRSDGGGLLLLGAATITGATIELGPDGRLLTNQNTIVSDSTFAGEFTIRSGQDITFGSGVVLPDGLVINEPGGSGEARLFVQEGVTLDGPIRLVGSTLGGQIIGLGDAQFLGPGAVITGERGAIIGAWTSEATIINDGPGGLGLSGLNVAGGTLHSSNGGRLDIAGATISDATIEAGPCGQFRTTRDTNISFSTIVGDYTLGSGQRLTLGPGVVLQDSLTIGAPGVAAQTQLYAEDGVTLDGPIRLAGLEGSEIIGLGTAHTLGAGSVITGTSGRLAGPWTTEGTIAMGDAAGPIGLLEFTGPILAMTPASRTEVDVAGPADDQFDRLEGVAPPGGPRTAVITLDGRLRVGFAHDYVPDGGDRFEIVRAAAVEGVFADADIEPVGGLGGVGPAHMVYTGQAAILVICAADRDGDGELTVFDFLTFQNQFDAGDTRADLDQDGTLTIFDFLVFQNRFAAGCG
ncbi:MAG: GC-type dockerin domain-anchored protein [Phycisphaerales bacterium JB060]